MIVIREFGSVKVHSIIRGRRTHKRNGRNEVIFQGRIMFKNVNVHAKEPDQERERQEIKCDPAEPPEADIKFERLA